MSLPTHFYTQIAPLPVPLGEHVYRYFLRKSKESHADTEKLFLQQINEIRESVFLYMDSFVRNRDKPAPHHLTFSPEWIRRSLAPYTPDKKEIPAKTYNHWLSVGLMRHSAKGQPIPDSGAALAVVRMMIEGTKVFPRSMPPDEPAWWCCAQKAPESSVKQLPITDIPSLPAHALLWTPWAGASWDPAWLLLGESSGAIRFAGVQMVRGNIQYTLSLDELLVWKPAFSSLYIPGPFETNVFQALARLALMHLAQGRILLNT